MATREVNSFTSYELTEEEFLRGSVLSSEQLRVVQNDLVRAAEQRLNIVLDPKNIVAFAQQEASLQGQIAALRYIIDRSIASEEALKTYIQSIS